MVPLIHLTGHHTEVAGRHPWRPEDFFEPIAAYPDSAFMNPIIRLLHVHRMVGEPSIVVVHQPLQVVVAGSNHGIEGFEAQTLGIARGIQRCEFRCDEVIAQPGGTGADLPSVITHRTRIAHTSILAPLRKHAREGQSIAPLKRTLNPHVCQALNRAGGA